jgi:hypothetical protein
VWCRDEPSSHVVLRMLRGHPGPQAEIHAGVERDVPDRVALPLVPYPNRGVGDVPGRTTRTGGNGDSGGGGGELQKGGEAVSAIYGFLIGFAVALPLGIAWGEAWLRRQLRGRVRVVGYGRGGQWD